MELSDGVALRRNPSDRQLWKACNGLGFRVPCGSCGACTPRLPRSGLWPLGATAQLRKRSNV